MLKDFRFAVRQLSRSRGFSFTAILTLALGIGATTAIFTLVYDAMLRPLPFQDAGRLVTIREKVAEWSNLYPTLPVSANHFTFWQQHSHSFAAMAAMSEYPLPLGGSGRPRQVGVLTATPGIFSVLEVHPRIGRAFNASEAQPGHERVAILTDGLWREQFGSDSRILGKTITLGGYPYTVIGVMSASFHLPPIEVMGDAETRGHKPLGVLVPMAFSKDRLEEVMGDLNYFCLARLRPTVSTAAASAELNAEQHTISAGLPADSKATLSAVLTPWQQELVGNNRTPLILLLAAVAGLLLVGCVNIANLLLARAAGQRRQMAVAAALGANRAELLRMSMRETVVLAVIGCGLGILLASSLVPAMQHYLPPALDFRGPMHLDWRSAAVAVVLALAATLLAGSAPGWMSARTAPHEVLHSEARLASESRSSRRMRRILVAMEVAVSVALLLMTGLVTLSMIRLMRVHRGFDAEHILTTRIQLPGATYSSTQQQAHFYQQVLSRLQQMPGVESAGITNALPLSGDGWGDAAQPLGDTRPWTQLPEEQFRWVSPGLFHTLRLRLIEGRFFTPGDRGQNLAVVTQLTAQSLWKGQNVIGRQFILAGRTGMKPFTIVGVVANARTVSLAHPDPMLIYTPYWFRTDGPAGLVVRTRVAPPAMAQVIRKTIWSLDPTVPVPPIVTLGTAVADSVANRRFVMDLLLLFAASALLLAGLGVYGVINYSVVQRYREIGLRIALGAQRGNIYALVLRDGLLPVVLGATAGLGAAFASARLLGSLLFQVSPYNPRIAAVAVAVLLAVGLAACLLPARFAARAEPMEALRSE